MPHGKLGYGDNYEVADVRQLDDSLRHDTLARELVAANKDLFQAETVLARAELARDGLNEKIEGYKGDVNKARERAEQARDAVREREEA